MFEVRVESSFEAGHRCGPGGEETSLHHHEWQVAARARAVELAVILVENVLMKVGAQRVDLVEKSVETFATVGGDGGRRERGENDEDDCFHRHCLMVPAVSPGAMARAIGAAI